jgi:hypothetical protein
MNVMNGGLICMLEGRKDDRVIYDEDSLHRFIAFSPSAGYFEPANV